MHRNVTLRLSGEQAEEVLLAARVLNVTVVALIRDAVDEYLRQSAADPEFQVLVQHALADTQRALRRYTRD